MRGLLSILSLFCNKFDKFNNTEARMLDSIYHMTMKLLKNCILGMKTSRFCCLLTQCYNGCHNIMLINLKPLVVY